MMTFSMGIRRLTESSRAMICSAEKVGAFQWPMETWTMYFGFGSCDLEPPQDAKRMRQVKRAKMGKNNFFMVQVSLQYFANLIIFIEKTNSGQTESASFRIFVQ